VLKVQFASQQIPGSRSGFVGKLLLCLAHLFIVDLDSKHQYFFLLAGVNDVQGRAQRGSLCERSILGFRAYETDFEVGSARGQFASGQETGDRAMKGEESLMGL